ncbi:hypothetical protein L195_g036600, partial [Trifolium pratense]
MRQPVCCGAGKKYREYVLHYSEFAATDSQGSHSADTTYSIDRKPLPNAAPVLIWCRCGFSRNSITNESVCKLSLPNNPRDDFAAILEHHYQL